VIREYSTLTSIFVQWDEVKIGDIPILGYKLYLIEISSGLESLIYDGSLNAERLSYLI